VDDIVAVEIRLADGESRYFLTHGRIQDVTDPVPLAHLVLERCRSFDLGGEPVSARVRWYLNAAAAEPYFYECLSGVIMEAADVRAMGVERTNERMREGKLLWYCGRHRLTEPEEPHAHA